MRSQPILDAFAKTEWARDAIGDLDRRIAAFFSSSPYEVRFELNEANEQVWRFELTKPFPRKLLVEVGAILHALRTPLDQLVAAGVNAAGRSQSGVGFVFSDTPASFKAELLKQKKLTPALRQVMRDARPYRGGDEYLWTLHALNRADKHRMGLVPIILPAETRMSYLRFDHGLGIQIGCRSGQHLSLADKSRIAHAVLQRPPTALYQTPPGTFLSFGEAGTPGDESLEFLRTTPGAKFETDFRPALEVGFDHDAVRGEPVTAVLTKVLETVEGVVRRFEEEIF